MWSFIPRLPDKISTWNAPFRKYTSSDEIMNALLEYKGRVHGVLEIKSVADMHDIKLSETQWRIDGILSAAFANVGELKTQIQKVQNSKLPADSIHCVYLYDIGYFIK
jgi:hypothetical protein